MNFEDLIPGKQYILHPTGILTTFVGGYYDYISGYGPIFTFRTKDEYDFVFTEEEVLDRIFDIVEETSKSISQILN